jgi:CO/xanthine dehydrogenase FAD-binding subunit
MTASFEYHRPTTLKDALRLGESIPGARFIAGGTDVMVRMREGKVHASALVSLSRVAELQGIESGPPLVIGGGVRVSDLQVSADVARLLPVLVQATRQLGSVQIRNSATVGGNLCNASPCADLAPPLLVHEARVRLESAGGVRELPLEDFFVGPRTSILEPGEILRAIVVDRAPADARAVFLKKGRVQMDIALGSVAVLLQTDGRRCVRARVAAGSLGPRPMRLREVERALEGAMLEDATIARAREAASAEVKPISDVRASADYRRHLAGALLERGVRALLVPSEAQANVGAQPARRRNGGRA